MLLLSYPFIDPEYKTPIAAERQNPHDKFLRSGVAEQYKKVYKKQREIILRAHANPDATIYESVRGTLAITLRPLSRYVSSLLQL
jgi:hypothetical protein